MARTAAAPRREDYRPPSMISWPLVLATLVVIGGMWATGIVTSLVLLACVVAAFVNAQRALQAMMVATLVAYANPFIFHHVPFSGPLLRFVLIAMTARMLPAVRASDLRVIWPVWLFSLLCAITSSMTSPALPISLMKIVTFGLAATAVLVAFRRVPPRALVSLQTWFVSLGVTVISVSGLMLLKPGLGAGGDGGLQGLLNQPQALGIFIAPFAAWALTGAFLMRRRASRLEIWFAVAAVGLIIVTKARTAGAATLLALGVVVLARILVGRQRTQATLGRPLLLAGAAAVVIGALALTTGKVGTVLTDYAFKGSKGEVDSLGGAFYESRGSGVLAEWQNFLHRPLTGNGFGVYPDGHFPVGVQYFAGIPISAPVEKGFLLTAVLEEDGIPGGVTLFLLIYTLGREVWRHPDLRWRALFCACLGINIGECVFLAPGGIGMFDWLLVGLALSAHRADRFRRRMASAPTPIMEVPPLTPKASPPPAPPAGPAVPGWWAA